MALYDFAYKIRLSYLKKNVGFFFYFFQMKTISVYYFLKHSDIAFESVSGLLTLHPCTLTPTFKGEAQTFPHSLDLQEWFYV